MSFIHGKHKDSDLSDPSESQASVPSDLQASNPSRPSSEHLEAQAPEPPGPTISETVDRDHRYAIETIGNGSAYKFFLSEKRWSWVIALAVVVAQILMLYVFVLSSDDQDLSNDNSDLVYTWKCPRDGDVCRDTIGMDELVDSLALCVCPLAPTNFCVFLCF